MKRKSLISAWIIPAVLLFSQVSTGQPVKREIDSYRLKYNNPEMKVDLGVGLWSSPLPLDFDNDGDLDLVISCTDVPYNGTYFFENASGEMSAGTVFRKPVKISQGITNVTTSYPEGKVRILGSGLEYTEFGRYLFGRPVGLTNAGEILSQHPR
jgi:hypothetical protein